MVLLLLGAVLATFEMVSFSSFFDSVCVIGVPLTVCEFLSRVPFFALCTLDGPAGETDAKFSSLLSKRCISGKPRDVVSVSVIVVGIGAGLLRIVAAIEI